MRSYRGGRLRRLRGFCSHLWHGGWDCSSHGRSDGRCRRGLQRPALAYYKNECSNSESGQHNQGAAQIRQTRTLPVFGLENGQQQQHYTIRYLAHLGRVEPRISVVIPKQNTTGSPQGRYHPARMGRPTMWWLPVHCPRVPQLFVSIVYCECVSGGQGILA